MVEERHENGIEHAPPRMVRLPVAIVSAEPTSLSRMEQDETMAAFHRAFAHLHDEERTVLRLITCERLSLRQVAEHLGHSPGWVMNVARRARAALHQAVNSLREEP